MASKNGGFEVPFFYFPSLKKESFSCNLAISQQPTLKAIDRYRCGLSHLQVNFSQSMSLCLESNLLIGQFLIES